MPSRGQTREDSNRSVRDARVTRSSARVAAAAARRGADNASDPQPPHDINPAQNARGAPAQARRARTNADDRQDNLQASNNALSARVNQLSALVRGLSDLVDRLSTQVDQQSVELRLLRSEQKEQAKKLAKDEEVWYTLARTVNPQSLGGPNPSERPPRVQPPQRAPQPGLPDQTQRDQRGDDPPQNIQGMSKCSSEKTG